MSLGSFILVQVGKAIIRIRPEKLGATLRRFKGAKEIKKPTDAQLDKSQTITKDLGNFNKADRKIVAKADRARPNLFETLFGTGRSSGQKIMKEVPTGESRRATKKLVVSTTVGTGGGFALGKNSEKDKGGSTTVKSDEKSKKAKKKTPNVPTEKPTPRPKTKQFMKERSGKDSKVEFGTGKAKTKLSTGGATGLKKISDDQPGLKALKKKAPGVVRNMGYLRKGSLVTKKKTKGGSKGGKGILVVSIGVGKMTKKKPTTKKKTTKKTKRA